MNRPIDRIPLYIFAPLGICFVSSADSSRLHSAAQSRAEKAVAFKSQNFTPNMGSYDVSAVATPHLWQSQALLVNLSLEPRALSHHDID